MPHPFAQRAIAFVHRKFYSADYPEAIQVFSGTERLLNSSGDNPVVLEISPEEKVLMGLTEFATAYRVKVLGRGLDDIDVLVQPTVSWSLSFDNGATRQTYVLSGTITPDVSMQCWRFALYRSVGNG